MEKKIVRPKKLIENEAVKDRFRNVQDIGFFIRIFQDKIWNMKIHPTIFVDENEFIKFLKYIENYPISDK